MPIGSRLGQAILVLCCCVLSHAAVAAKQDECDALAALRIEDTNLLSATVVPAKDGLPEHCRVLGYVRPAINFEVRMPTENWNEKFYMAGCGSYCGKVDSDRVGPLGMNHGLQRNYAVSTMDGGHWAPAVWNGRWGYHNLNAEMDYGYRAVTETARVSKTLIREFYGAKQKRSYFNGCSNGGRQALMEAWRYPEDFDGIIAGAPSLDMTGLLTWFAWVVQANTGPDGKDILAREKVKMIGDAVTRACDAKDGLKDGIIDDPRNCDFKPASLQCTNDRGGSQCLSAREVSVLDKWYGGLRNARGEVLYPGAIPYGSEPFWWVWLVGREKIEGYERYGFGRTLPAYAANYFPYLAFPDDPGTKFGPLQFDFEKDPPRLAEMGEIYNATGVDHSRFKARGGKLLLWHGWQDAIVTPERTVQYYNDLEKEMGGRASTQEFLKLFMVPGMDHCGNLASASIAGEGFDPVTALEQWVEKGAAPDRLLATKKDPEGKVLWTRPLCPYPSVTKYRGRGDSQDAAAFDCVVP